VTAERRPHRCPVCDGAGKVSRPPWEPGDVPHVDLGRLGSFTSTGTYQCNACLGTGVIWEPLDLCDCGRARVGQNHTCPRAIPSFDDEDMHPIEEPSP
jgi:hypothetical protein